MLTRLLPMFLCCLACVTVVAQRYEPVRFDPEHQRPVKLVTPGMTVEVIARPPDSTTGESRVLRIETPAGESRIGLPFQMYQVNSIHEGPGKLVIVGMQAGAVYVVAIVNIVPLGVVDHFTCYSPAVSPDGGYVTFTKFFGPHSAPSPDDHNMLYLVGRPPSDNRPVGISLEDHEDVGFEIYPVGVGNWKADNMNVAPETAHHFASYYFWMDSRQYLFADRTAGEFRIVWVEISGLATGIRDIVIAPSSLPVSQSGFPPRLSDASVKGEDITLSIQTTLERTLVISKANFVRVGSVNLAELPQGAQ